MANMENSRIVVWDCTKCETKEITNYDYSLLLKKATVIRTKSMAPIALYQKYELPKMWFTHDYKRIILENPFNNSYIAVNKSTDKKTIKRLLEKYTEGKSSNAHDPVFHEHNIFFLKVENNNTVVSINNK